HLYEADEMRGRFPQHVVDDGTVGFYESGAGVIRPERAVVAAVSAAHEHGARVLTGSAVSRIGLDGPRVLGDGRALTGRHGAGAAGGGRPRLVPSLAKVLRPLRRVMAWFPIDAPGLYDPPRFPVFIRTDSRQPGVWYGLPSLDGSTVKLGLHDWPGIDEPLD